MTFRCFCFTINNPTEADSLEPLAETEHFRYMVCQLERGENGTPHVQGYCQLKKPMRQAAIKRLIPRAHIEKARGSYEDNLKYCTKEEGRLDGPFFWGEPTQQGARNDLNEFAQAVKRGAKDKELYETYLDQMAKFPRLRNELRNVFINSEKSTKVQAEGRKVIVYVGATGTGKTRKVHESCPKEELFIFPPPISKAVWFDGYGGENFALLDDFSSEWMSIVYLLRITDRYPLRVPVKGSFVEWCPHTVYITSNLHPTEWYPDAYPQHRDALMRRISEIIQF